MAARMNGRRRLGRVAGPAALAGLVLGLTACHPPHPHRSALHEVSTLDCPETQGDLTRKTAAPDGKSCVYAGDQGDQVTLRLISLDGKDFTAAIAPIEAELKAEAPGATARAAAGSAGPSEGARGSDKDRVDINLPGIHIHAHGDGGADVDAAGVHVEAHDKGAGDGGRADVRIGDDNKGDGVHINANEQGAQIRIDEGGSGIRARYILASETPGPHGFKAAGYEARGPAGGPVVVAVMLTKSGDGDDDLRHDVRNLLRRNVGG